MPRKQDENLIPFDSSQNREEAAKNGKKGGIASGKARREKKALKETLQTLLAATLKDPGLIKQFESLGIAPKGMSMQDAVVAAMIRQAVKGNVKAYREIRETLDKKDDTVESESSAIVNIVFADTSEGNNGDGAQ